MYLIIFHNNVASLVLVLEHLIELYSYHELIDLTGQEWPGQVLGIRGVLFCLWLR